MNKYSLPLSLLAGLAFSIPCIAQQATEAVEEEPATTYAHSYAKILPKDLPQSKLLFIKFSPVAENKELTETMSGRDAGNMLYMRDVFNSRVKDANKQLAEAVVHYPFACRITTQDSVSYYKKMGYKYKLYSDSFGASMGAYYNSSPRYISVEVYLKDLINYDRYVFSHTDKDMVLAYRAQVAKLLRMVEKQFGAKK